MKFWSVFSINSNSEQTALMSSSAAFIMFTPEAEEGSETPPAPVMTNSYMVSWIERITMAIEKELAKNC